MSLKRPLFRAYLHKLLPAHGSFSHKVLIMFTGTALGQLMSVLLAPLLTRTYSPDAFGMLGSFSALCTIFSVIATLRYEMALPLARTAREAMNLVAVGCTALLATFVAGTVMIALLPTTALALPAALRWWLPVGVSCIGAYQLMVYLATRQGSFAALARTKIYQGVIGPVSQLVFGVAGMGAGGLLLGFILGQSAGVLSLFRRLITRHSTTQPLTEDSYHLQYVSWPDMRQVAVRFIRFPLISSWAGLVNAAGSSAFLLVAIPLCYSSSIAGFVFLVDRIIGRPLLLISTSILQVYLGDAGHARHQEQDASNLRRRFVQIARFQGLTVSLWLLMVNGAAPFVFTPLFGAAWQDAVPYLHILSLCYLPQMVMHALIHTLQMLERQALSAVWEIGRLLAVAGAFIGGYALGYSALHVLLLYSIAQGASQLVLFYLMWRSIKSLHKTK